MIIRAVKMADWDQFCTLAAAEGWRVPQSELQRFQTDWSHFVQVLEVDGGFAGLVTAVPHEHSGWVGNLIVPPHLRGRGYGGRLFQAAQKDLTDRGMSSIWLTASEQGRPLYEKSGFAVVDRVERWVLNRRSSSGLVLEKYADAGEKLLYYDRKAWGESRISLFESLSWQGRACACDDATALLQSGGDMQVIGPWYSESNCPHANSKLLQTLLAATEPGVEIIIDLFASSGLHSMFKSAGFVCIGDADLMAVGDVRSVSLKMMVSLASLGSIG